MPSSQFERIFTFTRSDDMDYSGGVLLLIKTLEDEEISFRLLVVYKVVSSASCPDNHYIFMIKL